MVDNDNRSHIHLPNSSAANLDQSESASTPTDFIDLSQSDNTITLSQSRLTSASSHRNALPHDHLHSTPPTSYSTHPFHLIDQKPPDSDLEAQYGSSDDARVVETSSGSSLSSTSSTKALPLPSTQDTIRDMGHHLPDPIDQIATRTGLQPNDDWEARVIMDRVDRARVTNRAADAFESHLISESCPELPIQREQIRCGTRLIWRAQGNVQAFGRRGDGAAQVAIVEDPRYRRRTYQKMRASILILAFVLLFVGLSIVLYSMVLGIT